jgi:hypothetical protein
VPIRAGRSDEVKRSSDAKGRRHLLRHDPGPVRDFEVLGLHNVALDLEILDLVRALAHHPTSTSSSSWLVTLLSGAACWPRSEQKQARGDAHPFFRAFNIRNLDG